MRALIGALLGAALACTPAAAQCPVTSAGWSASWPGQPITSAAYDESTKLLYVVFGNSIQVSAFSNVPLTTMQSFIKSKQPLSYFNSFIVPAYHAMLLSQIDNCPILLENGAYLWTD